MSVPSDSRAGPNSPSMWPPVAKATSFKLAVLFVAVAGAIGVIFAGDPLDPRPPPHRLRQRRLALLKLNPNNQPQKLARPKRKQ